MSSTESKPGSCLMRNLVSSCVKTNLPTLIYLSMPSGYEGVVYANAKASLRKALAECAHNVLYGEIDFTDEERQVLRSHAKDLTLLSQGKKIDPDILPKILAPVIPYVCEGATKQDIRGLRQCSAERGAEQGMEDCGEGEADTGHQ